MRWMGWTRLNNSGDPAPGATVTVRPTRQSTLATIYAANDPAQFKANPFTAGSDGFAYFYAAGGRYDVQFSGGGIVTPYSLGDILLYDPGSVGS